MLLSLRLLYCRFLALLLEQQNLDSEIDYSRMPRPPDIGWQHGTMIGGHRHHVQCNYCHRTMIGGITRFKKHLASKRGEIKGCEAVPKEVRETIRKHLASLKPRRPSKKKLRRIEEGAILVPISTNGNVETDASDPDETNTRQELLTLQEAEIQCMAFNISFLLIKFIFTWSLNFDWLSYMQIQISTSVFIFMLQKFLRLICLLFVEIILI